MTTKYKNAVIRAEDKLETLIKKIKEVKYLFVHSSIWQDCGLFTKLAASWILWLVEVLCLLTFPRYFIIQASFNGKKMVFLGFLLLCKPVGVYK